MKRAALAWGASAVACLALAVAPDGRGAAPPADTLPLARIVALLGADEPKQREDAVRRLARRVDALPLLRRAAASPDPESAGGGANCKLQPIRHPLGGGNQVWWRLRECAHRRRYNQDRPQPHYQDHD